MASIPTNDELLTVCNSAKACSIEFTGERAVPNAIEPQLWNEHVARYRFASLFASERIVLDVGCGTGYGSELLAAKARQVVGFDIAKDAIDYATAYFSRADYVCASATEFPVADHAFGLVTAFEVIEHLSDWKSLVKESARVLSLDGVFLISTPNIEYYEEARGPSGPNPYHVHEFDRDEFERELRRCFPFVEVLAQNQQETIAFAGDWRAERMAGFVPPANDVADAHFFVAVCSFTPLNIPFFADVSSSHNLLRERETHIRGLQGELAVAESQKAALEAEIVELRLQLESALEEQHHVKKSAWMRLGRVLGVGPWSTYRADAKAFLQRQREWLDGPAKDLQSLFLCFVTLFSMAVTAIALGAADIGFALFGKKRLPPDTKPAQSAASIVIPTWNRLDLLQANLPSVMEAVSSADGSEVIVVDNASTDGTREWLRSEYPQVRVLPLPVNEGFAAACNRGAKEANCDIVVFLNNDMRVEENFLTALLKDFTDPLVFAASSQIFFTDTDKLREETGLTEVWWDKGLLGVGHRIDPLIQMTYPCAYPGGGSSAFDRSKFLELGGFDSLFHPFYYEDTDLGFRAWKRGWKVLYEPESVVHHEHRATIAKAFAARQIENIVRQNELLYCWKNIHDWTLLATQFYRCLLSLRDPDADKSVKKLSPAAIRRAVSKLPQTMASRWRAHQTRKFSDRETFRRPLGGYFRDRFLLPGSQSPEPLNVLLVSPYPIEPPVHGGAVFMRDAVNALGSAANVHLVSFVDREEQLESQNALVPKCASTLFVVRPHVPLYKKWTLTPTAIREFAIPGFEWSINRTILQQSIDVVQLEYTIMGQYAGQYRHIPCMLFEHDISAQTLWRRIKSGDHDIDLILEYLRMRIYEPKLLKRLSRIQVCSRSNADYLCRLVKGISNRVDCDIRATIDVQQYRYVSENREPDSLLFVGSFRHWPNLRALRWFMQKILPLIVEKRPQTLLYVAGSEAPDDVEWHPNVRLLGSVPDVKVPLQRYSVFVCPVLHGSGIRVKLLEAFAAGIPAVSTRLGAEGLASESGFVCEIADAAEEFAQATLKLLDDEAYRRQLAENARRLVEDHRDSRRAVKVLESLYREEVGRMRGTLAEPTAEALEPCRLQGNLT